MAQVVLKPDDEEFEVITSELGLAKKQLHTLRLHRDYEQHKFEGTIPEVRGRGTNLLEYLSRGQKDARSGAKLEADLVATEARVAVLERRYDDYQARHEAYLEASTTKADDPGERAK